MYWRTELLSEHQLPEIIREEVDTAIKASANSWFGILRDMNS
jgi:hypothetical protein